MSVHHRRRLYVANESTFATDPDSDGSDYLWVPGAAELGDLDANKEQIESNYVSDADVPAHAPVIGKDGWKLDVTFPLIGLSADVGDGGSHPTDDWLDIILTHVFGTQAQIAGEGVGSGSTTSSLVMDTDAYSEGDIIPIYDASLSTISPNRVQWAYLDVDAGTGTYSTILPSFVEAPTTAGVGYGTNTYRLNVEDTSTLSFFYDYDGYIYWLGGGHRTSAKISMPKAGGKWMMTVSFEGDRCTPGASPGSLSSPGGASAQISNTPVRGVGSPIWFANTKLSSVASVEIDLGIQSTFVDSTEGQEGRGAANLITMIPTVTVKPLHSGTYAGWQRAATEGGLMIQMGRGQAGATAGTTDSLAFYIRNAYCSQYTTENDNGKLRQSLTFKPATQIRHSAATKENTFQLARA